MGFNINSSVNLKSIGKVGNNYNNTAFKDKFYGDADQYTYDEIDYSNDAGIDVESGKAAAEQAKIDRIKREEEEARLKAEEERNAKLAELDDLYRQRDENNGFLHPIKEKEIEDAILKLEGELNVPHNPDGWEKTCDVVVSTGATIVVGATSVASGGVKLVEHGVDGGIWVGGTVVSGTARLVGADDFAEGVENLTMDAIAFDATGALNDAFYNGVGKGINDASYLKYDSDIAKGIQNGSEKVIYFAGATAATVVTGGAAAPLFLGGFAIGAGESAEEKFQDTENRDYWGSAAGIGIDGVVGGIEAVGMGKSGAAAYKGIQTISSIGLSGTKEAVKAGLSNMGKETFKNTFKTYGKDMVKNAALSTLKEGDFYMDTAAMWADDIKNGIETGEFDYANMAGELFYSYGSNFVGNLGGEYFINAEKAKAVVRMTGEQGSFVHISELCKKAGISEEEFLRLSRIPNHELTTEEQKIVYSISTSLFSDVTTADGCLMDGTEIVKYYGSNIESQGWFADGNTARATGCIALARDAGDSSMEVAVNQLGLDYSNNPFYKNSDPSLGLEDYCYRITGEARANSPMGADNSITIRVSSTTDYVPSGNGTKTANQIWTENASMRVDELSEVSGVKHITVENPDWGFNSPYNPDTGTGITKNRFGDDYFGSPELNGSHPDLVSDTDYGVFTNGKIERVYSDGRVEVVGEVDKAGKIKLYK